MKKQLFILLFVLSIVGSNAQPLYFKCTTATSGQFNWGTLSNWYTDVACTSPASGIPISSSDVFFGVNTFTANGQKINFDQANMYCKKFTVNYAGVFTGSFQCTPGFSLNINGDVDLTAFNTSSLSIINWNADVNLLPANSGTINILTGSKQLRFNSINIPGDVIQYTVNFNDSLFLDRQTPGGANAGIINIGIGKTASNSVKVNFNDLLKLGSINAYPATSSAHAVINIISGDVNFKNGIFYTLPTIAYQNALFSTAGGVNQGGLIISNSSSVTLSPQTFTSVGYPTARNRSVIGLLQVQGTSTANAPTLTATNQTLQINGFCSSAFANTNYTNSMLNINLYGQRNAYAGMFDLANTTTLTTTGSTINIAPNGNTSVNFPNLYLAANTAFNVFNIYDHCLTYFSAGVQTFNQLNFMSPDKNYTNYASSTSFSINPGGSVYIAPGSSLGSFTSAFRFAPTASLTMLGTCGHDIALAGSVFSFSAMPLSNMAVDRVVLNNCTATGTGTLYPAGANSRFIYNTTNTGWNVNCTPPARTLYWQGALTGGNWSDPNNWSINSSASPTSTQAPISVGACEPTENDSVVFPPQSYVLLNKLYHYSNSVNIISTATITTSNGAASYKNWSVSGGWWATNKFYNNFGGTIIFNTYKNFRCIKTGGVPFRYDLSFAATTIPNVSCVPITTVTSGGWLLLDTLVGNSTIYIGKGNFKTYDANVAYASFFPSSQKLGSTLLANSISINYPGTALDTVKFFDSDVYISNSSGSSLQLATPNALFKEGTAEFIVSGPNGYANSIYMSNYGNKIDELTIKFFNVIPNSSFNQTVIQNISQNNLGANVNLFMDSDTINRINNFQNLKIATNTNTLTGFIGRLISSNSNANSLLTINTSGNNNTVLTVDSFITNTPTNLFNTANTYSINVNVRKLFHLNGGGITLKMGNSNPVQFDNRSTITFSLGAEFKSDGACTNRNFITSNTPLGTATIFSNFNLLGAIGQTLTATDIQDNIVTGGFGTINTDGTSNGTTTGWVILGSTPRLLHWTDGSTAGGMTLDWSSSARWRKAVSGSTSLSSAPIVWSASPECPPLCQDTVVVDDASFFNNSDSVLINGVNYQAQVGKFYWRTTTGTKGFGGVTTSNLSICDSLYFSPFMANRFRGTITLKGNPTVANNLGLKMANQILRGQLVINCYNSNTTYKMRDSLTINFAGVGYIPNSDYQQDNSSILHTKGNLTTNGNNLNLIRYTSVGNFNRKLIADNSKVRIYNSAEIVGFTVSPVGWVVVNYGAVKTYSLSTKKTKFIFNTTSVRRGTNGMIGGGYNYNDVEFYGTGTGLLSVGYSNAFYAGYDPKSPSLIDTFNNVYNNITVSSSTNRLMVGPTYSFYWAANVFTPVYKTVIKNIFNNSAPMDIQGTHCYIDSLECYYRHNTYGKYNILTGNDYYKHVGLYATTAQQNIVLAKDSIQWLHNLCDFRPLGNNANKVTMSSNGSGTSLADKTYIRKDSGRVCADWLVLKNIWAIGSGISLGSVSTTTPAYTCTPGITPWLCDFDTLSTFDGLGYGPTTAISNSDPKFTLSKRAWFQGGNGTDFSGVTGNNQGWEMLDRTADPKLTLDNSSTICEGDTTTIRFLLEGPFPYSVNFNSNTNAPTFPAVSNNTLFINFATPTSYTQTPAMATYVSSSSPSGYVYYLVPANGTATDAGTSLNPFVLSVKVTPTVTTQYSLGYLVTGKCVNNVSTLVNSVGTATVNVNPAPKNILASVTPSVICNGSSVTYTASASNGNIYYLYSQATGTTVLGTMISYTSGASTNGSLTVSSYTNGGSSAITYSTYIGATSSYGCSSFTRTPLTVVTNPVPQITNAALQTICTGNTATVSVVNSFTTGVSNSWTSSSAAGITGHLTSGSGNFSETLVNTTTSPISLVYTYTPTTSSCAGLPQNYTVTVNPSPTMSSANTATVCSANAAIITLTSNISGSTYQWIGANNLNTTGESLTTQTTSVLNNTITNTSASSQNVTYTVTPTATLGNCVGLPQTVTVTVNPTPQMTSTSSATICSGIGLSISLSANVASSYTWVAANNTNVVGESTTNQTTSTITNTLITTAGSVQEMVIYTVTPISTVGNCIGAVQTVTVRVNSTPTIAVLAANNGSICANATGTIQATGGNTYTWSPATNLSSPTGSMVTFSAPSSTTSINYTYTIVTTNTITGCHNSLSPLTVTLTGLGAPIVTSVGSATICSGGVAIIPLTSSSASTYSWIASNNINTIGESLTTQTTAILNNTITSSSSSPQNVSYTVIPVSTLGSCIGTPNVVTVKVNPLPIIGTVSVTNVSCFGLSNGAISFSTGLGTPGYTITGVNVTGTTASSLLPTNYTYSVTDGVGCVNTTTLAITQPTAALLTNAAETFSNTSCTTPDGVASVTITGGTPGYTISPSSGLSTGTVITGLGTAIHSYIVTDSRGCNATNTVQITGALGITSTITALSNVLCFANATGSITINGLGEASGGYNYSLTPITGLTSASSNTLGVFNNLSSGTYSILVTGNLSSCISSQNVMFTQPTASLSLVGLDIDSVICNGGIALATVTLTGGTTPYNYQWSSNTSSVNVASYSAGSYTLSVSDANACSLASQSFTIEESPVLSISSVITTTTGCNLSNGTATITPQGGWNSAYTYTIINSSPSLISSTTTAANLSAGSYTVSITDALGCSTFTVFSIANPTTPTLAIAANPTALCAGQSITLTPTGAVSYTLENTATSFTTDIILNPTSSDVYTITAIDANNCLSIPLNVTVTVNALPQLTVTSSQTAICSGQTGIYTVTGADTYTWTGGFSNNSYTLIPTSQQTITVLGSNTVTGCVSLTETVVVVVNPAPTIVSIIPTNVLCFSGSTGSVSLVVNGGTPSYTYTWSNGATTQNISNLQVGEYTVILTDAGNCQVTGTVVLTEPIAIQIDIISTESSCKNGSTGSAIISVVGGTPNYSVMWSNGAMGVMANQIAQGNYTVTVTDNAGCVNTLSVVVPDIECETLFIPEIFSPNGDNKNEKFEIKKIQAYPNNTLQIFNRWGSLVYTKHKYNNEWDGKANVGDATGNAFLPAGTYYVILEFNDGQTETYKGFVQLEY